MYIQILAQQFYDYSLHIKGLSKDTNKRYRNIINYYCKFAKVETIDQVREEDIRAMFFHGRAERKWSPNTYICYHRSLTVFFRWCVEQKYMTRNPMTEIILPKVDRKLPPKLTKQEAFRLLEFVFNYPYEYRYLRYRNHAIFSMFVFAGLRKGELLHLKYTDVDIENLTIFIRKGKGNKDRIIPMSYTLAQTLKTYLQERSRLKKTCPEFFTSLNRNAGFTEDGLKHLTNKLKEAVDIDFTIHRLRHTFATLMLEGGCDIYSLSKMMGHSNINTTTIYLAASVEHLRGQITKHPLNEIGR
jgi:site-specific recombinase XerD